MAGKIIIMCPCCCCYVAMFTLVVFPFIGLCQDENMLPHPIGLYPLNKLYSTADASCYGNLAGIGQDIKLIPGPFGVADTAYEFAGVGTSHITIPQSPHLDAEKSITILVWIFQTGQAGSVVQYLNNNYRGVGLHTLNDYSLLAQFMERNENTVSFFSNHTVSLLNRWQYVGASYDYNSGTATLWIDGTDVQQMHLGKFKLSTNKDIRIGSGQGKGDSFEGRISCLQIYNKALTREEVSAVRKRCFQYSQAPVDCKTTSAPSGCGVPMFAQTGTFYSPGYPSGYPYDANCVWEIQVLDGYYIKLQFSKFDLEEAYLNKWPDCPDHVIIYDGITSWSTKLTALCGGQDGWEKEVISSGNGMRVEFVTNGVGSGRGFTASYSTSLIDKIGKEEENEEKMMDFSRHYTGIVIGVACAAIFAILSIITFSHTRRRLQQRRNGSLTNSRRREISFSDDIFQQNAPPTYDDVMRYPELYPPTPCQGSLANTPAGTPRQGSPESTPRIARRALSDRRGSPMLIPKVGTPIGMPLFNPLRGTSSLNTPSRTPRISIQRGISPLARAELTPQNSRPTDHVSSDEHDDDDDDELPPYPGIMGDNARGNYMPLNTNTDSVLDQVRETLEQRTFVPRQQSNSSLSDDNSSDSNHDEAVNAQSGSLASSRIMDNSGLSQTRAEANRNSTSSMPSESGYVNPWVSHSASQEGRYGAILRSIESDV